MQINKTLGVLVSIILGIYLLLSASNSLSLEAALIKKGIEPELPVERPALAVVEDVGRLDNLPLQDNQSIYQFDDPSSVVYMYVTVRKGNPSDNSDHTWEEVNNFTKWENGLPLDIVVGKAEVILQIGDEAGPLQNELGYDAVAPNATIQIRGNSTTGKDIKNYKIELRSNAGSWRGQTTLNLNKHLFDMARIRNKLSFDLLKQIPNMTSLRTQFVRLMVKDETSSPPQTTFADYGLFTQIEQPNRKFLQNHLLDPNGHLYKATFFEFHRYPDHIRTVDDPLYDEDAFSDILEIKGNSDHSKLIRMLDDVNNEIIPIEQTFEKYFNAENYFTWMAFNILIGNLDTQSQNFYLYSPQNSNTWYFLPWDYDGSLYRQSGFYSYEYFEFGISNYWGAPLHKRVLKVERYREMLYDKIENLVGILTPEKIGGMLQQYKKVTDFYVLQGPDNISYPVALGNYQTAFEEIPNEIMINYDLFQESLNVPMPFFLGVPKVSGGKMMFNWEESYDFNASNIVYDLIISRDLNFQDVVYQTQISHLTLVEIDRLEPGDYFWRVLAKNDIGKIQYPFDVYRDEGARIFPGMKYFYLDNNGRILE